MPKKYSVDAPAGMKSCPDCRETKALEEFHRKRGSQDGHGPYCKPCQSIRKKRYQPLYQAKATETHRLWCQANPDRVQELERRRTERDPHRHRRYYQARTLVYRERWQRRELLIKSSPPVNYAAIVARDGMVCGICGLAVDWPELSFDHIIPLSKRGPHMDWNIQVAHKVCNSRKGAKLKLGQMALPL